MSTLSRRAIMAETAKVLAVLIAIAGILIVCTSCHEDSPVFTPATGPGTEFHCVGRPTDVWCFPEDGTHTCCPEDNDCTTHGTVSGCTDMRPIVYDPGNTTFGAREPAFTARSSDDGAIH